MYFKEMKIRILAFMFLSLALAPIWAQGNVTYTLHKSTNPTEDELDAYAKIEAAMDSATYLYNKYTTLSKKINVYYNTGVPTAEANFDGVISFGSNRSYMVVITAMHEMGHVFGVGTTNEYKNMIVDGVFTGPLATAKIKEIDGEGALVKGDGTHFWPYGLNYSSEVKSEEDLIRHCLIVDALYKDLFLEEVFFTGKIKSDNGLCMVRSENSLILGDCNDQGANIRIIKMGKASPYTYRIEFSDLVLDIPNESTSSNIQVGLYSWNGKNHQKVVIDSVSGNIVRFKMNHCNLYLEASSNSVYQMTENSENANQKWTLISSDSEYTSISDSRKRLKASIQIGSNTNYVDLKGRVIPNHKMGKYQKIIGFN